MSLQRICDVGDCENPGMFHIGAWDEDSEKLGETADVCGALHAGEFIKNWLRDFAGLEPYEDLAATG